MCQRCTAGNSTVAPSRRHFLALAGAAAAGLVATGAAAQPKPQNIVSPDAALDRLMQGNSRYVNGQMKRYDFTSERAALAKGQNPYAGILSCADSRVAPEFAFDSGRGDLFVCRVAGNILDDESIASFEYASLVLGTPLFMVLGHKSCGAVDAAVKAAKGNPPLPGRLPTLVAALAPAVKASEAMPGNALDNAIRTNVLLTVEKFKTASPVIAKAIADGKARVVGGIYDLDTGRVDLVG